MRTPDSIDKYYELICDKYKRERMPWEPKDIFSKILGYTKNKYSKKVKENLSLICMLCNNTDEVSDIFHVPKPTLKTWIYKIKKMQPNYRYDWYPAIEEFDIKSKVRILYEMFFYTDIEKLAQMMKLSLDVVKDFVKDISVSKRDIIYKKEK